MNIFSDRDIQRIRERMAALTEAVTLRYTTADHPMDERFKTFAGQLAELAPRVRIKKDTDTPVDRPTLFVGQHTAYQALPSDRELEPFLDALIDGANLAGQLPPDIRGSLDRLQVPAMVKVYITPHCPFCPRVVSLLLGLAASSDRVRLCVIDGQLFPGAAAKDRVNAAPTIVLDDRFRWTGSVNADELVTMMLERDPASLGVDALRGLIEDGDADQVARMMVDGRRLFAAFFDLLAHPRWSVRLGAMVAFETLAELEPTLAEGVVDPLMTRFGDADDAVKGDLLHVIGESGNRTALPFLQAVAVDAEDEEVRAAAAEAIEKLA